ncbi:MAG: GIY-YIG nuclease family protein [Planctomycetaceae bacterium]|jgi:hypothetical protein|nr:GIY-YIG nuclease family protein [Planctomycetaceae bacterium]
MTKGYVYILTNPCMPGWVKIGMTDKTVEERVKSLNSHDNIPLRFRIYAFLETENAYNVEQSIHKIIDAVDAELHAREELEGGGTREREFFDMSPAAAYTVFEQVAALLGDSAKLTKIEPTEKERTEENIAKAIASRLYRKWDEDSFFQQAESTVSPATLQAIRKLYDWSLKNADEIKFGTGNRCSFNPRFKESIGCPFSVSTNGTLKIYAGWHSPEINQRLCDAFEAKSVGILQGKTTEKLPTIPADYVTQNIDAITKALDEFVALFPPKE